MTTSKQSNIILFLGVLFVALNLRGPFTSVAPVLGQVMEDLSLTASSAGMLTSLPLLTFAIFSPIAPVLSRKLGLYPSLLLAILLIGIGIIMRSLGSEFPLYLGTVFIGAGIAAGNVLLPVVVKVSFPTRISVITSLYIFTMGIGSTLGASLMVPISMIEVGDFSGWQVALSFNLIFPLLALIIWLPKIVRTPRKNTVAKEGGSDTTMLSLLKCPVAWQVTLAIGINSFTFYSLAGWLPKMLNDLGYSELEAGYIYGLLQFSTMVPGLVLAPILSKTTSQRWLITGTASAVFLGLIGLVLIPDFAIFWVVLFGVGNCSTFIIALSFVGLRTTTSGQAAALSGLSQSIGYALAATGPTVIGYLRALTGTWVVPIGLIAVLAVLCTLFANLAARDNKVLQGLN